MSTSATYTQLRDGQWGIRVPGKARENQIVQVAKKSGEVKGETVSRVLWTGRDSKSGQTISLCAIRPGEGRHGEARRSDDDQCNCWQCRRGSECQCIYGRG